MTGNRGDRELDIVLLSTKDGQVIRNLTTASISRAASSTSRSRAAGSTSVPWMSWSPPGDRLAFFVRTEKDRSLVVENVHHAQDRSQRVPMNDGRRAGVAGLLARRQDWWRSRRRAAASPTSSPSTSTPGRSSTSPRTSFADYAPDLGARRPSRSSYLKRVSGNEKLFRARSGARGKSTQLTFGTHDEGGAQFLDADTLVFTSTAVDPGQADRSRSRRRTAPSTTCGRST